MEHYSLTDNDRIIIALTFILYCTTSMLGNSPYESSIIFGITILIFVFNKFKLSLGVYHIATIQFCIFCLASIFWARNYYMAMVKGYTIFQNIVLITVLYSYFSRLKTIDPLLKIYMWCGYLTIAYSMYYYGPLRVLGMGTFGRLENGFANVNSIGMMAAITVTIHLFFHNFKEKSPYIFLIVPAIMLIATTQSRKAIVSLLFGISMVYFFKHSKDIKDNLLPILRIGFAATILVVIVLISSKSDIFTGATQRMEGLIAYFTGEGNVDSSTSVRAMMRELGWQQFRETPYLGIGIGNARLLCVEYLNKDCYLHCNYAELAADGGIFGLLSYYGIYIYLIWKLIKFIKVEPSTAIVLIILFSRLISEWGLVSYYTKTTYFLLMIYFIHLKICQKKYPEIK